MAVDPATLIQALQQALAGQQGGEAVQQLLNILAATVQKQASQATMLQQHVQQLETRIAASAQAERSQTGAGLVDTKTLGRVDKFKGARKDWTDWSFAFRAFLGGVDPKAVEALHWAAAQAETITSVAIDLEDNN